jgi:hypothetical protein
MEGLLLPGIERTYFFCIRQRDDLVPDDLDSFETRRYRYYDSSQFAHEFFTNRCSVAALYSSNV